MNKFIFSIFIIFLLFIFNSCAYYLNYLLDENKIEIKERNKASFPNENICKANSTPKVIISDKQRAQFFKNFLGQPENKTLSFLDKTVLLSMLESLYNPIMSSPASSIFIIYVNNGKISFYSSPQRPTTDQSPSQGDNFIHNKTNYYPYLDILNKILLDNKNKKNLNELATIFDKSVRIPIKASTLLSKRANQISKYITQDETLKNAFIRGKDIIKENESLPKISWKKVISNYPKSKKIINSFKMDSFKSSNRDLQCNFNYNDYLSNQYNIKKNSSDVNMFGFLEKNNGLIVISSQSFNTDKVNPILKSHFIQAKPNFDLLKICQLNIKKSKYLLFSTQGRDPAQYVFNGINTFQDSMVTSSYLSQRKLFLKNPERIIIEYDKKIENKFDIPVYYQRQLGSLFLISINKHNLTLFTDFRSTNNINCQ